MVTRDKGGQGNFNVVRRNKSLGRDQAGGLQRNMSKPQLQLPELNIRQAAGPEGHRGQQSVNSRNKVQLSSLGAQDRGMMSPQPNHIYGNLSPRERRQVV